MRYGVLSNVHGNLHALRAAVTALRRQGVERWLCLGNLVGYGRHPNECVELVAELDPVAVSGNHDLVAVGELFGASSSPRARRSHEWTHGVLRDDVLAHLAALPRRAEVDGVVVLAHGSLDDPEEYVSTPSRAQEQLSQLAREHPAARLLLLGHTHRQRAYSEVTGPLALTRLAMPLAPGDRHLVNPGSVGQSREWELPPRSAAAVVDLDAGTLLLRRVSYDLPGAVLAVRRSGLPYRVLHSPPPVLPALRRRFRRPWVRPAARR
jgi:predicted phosphodiesterase